MLDTEFQDLIVQNVTEFAKSVDCVPKTGPLLFLQYLWFLLTDFNKSQLQSEMISIILCVLNKTHMTSC